MVTIDPYTFSNRGDDGKRSKDGEGKERVLSIGSFQVQKWGGGGGGDSASTSRGEGRYLQVAEKKKILNLLLWQE